MPQAPIDQKPTVDAPRGAIVPGDPSTYPPNLFSGQQRRLQFEGMEDGMVYHVFNDEGPNLSLAQRSGWVFSSSEKIKPVDQVVPANKDVGTKVCYEVGHNSAGHPLYAYVMEMPYAVWEYQQTGPGSREEYHKSMEAQIRAGTYAQKANDGRYTATNPVPGSPSSLPRINIKTNLAR